MILTEKFYLFDVGITNYLARRRPLLGSAEFGKSFEQFILMEIMAYKAYRSPDLPITFWRASTGQEVDFILGDKEVAVEVKGGSRVHSGDLTHLVALSEDGPVKKKLVVCLEQEPRSVDSGIQIVPWPLFLKQLWAGDLVQ